jgi:O-antigen biosynthesis protein
MPKRRSLSPELAPARDVAVGRDGFVALSREPWIKLQPVELMAPGRVVEIRYSTAPTDEVVRPIIRFLSASGARWDSIMPAASEGAGIWCGRVPPETADVWISPTNRKGAFAFRVDAVRTAPLAALVGRRLASPKRSFFAASARMVGLRDEADLNLRWVFGHAETQDFLAWRSRRTATPATSIAGDAPSCLVVLQGGGSLQDFARTHESLAAQTRDDWRLALVGASAEQARFLADRADPRARLCASIAEAQPEAGELVGLFNAGDVFVAHALASFAALFARRPELTIAYCDETRAGTDGRPTPLFKPDWSPMLQRGAPYVGRAAFMTADVFAHQSATGRCAPEEIVAAALAGAANDAVGHVRRALAHVGRPPVEPVAASSIVAASTGSRAKIGIVIPTRDRIDLLEPCLVSVLEKTAHADFEIVVVDNDSVEERTARTLSRLCARDSRLSVAPSPGAFNFSALCNFGAQKLSCDFLLFLNNDTEVLQADWLDNLVAIAGRPDVGAVGAKLLYPTGRVQHAGVVLGMGGVAGHFGEGQAADAPGWLGTLQAPHEASAVTAACLMVERRKFDAIGGFDALNLPVELNDIDLCLRLGEQGWGAICDCRTRLVHHESASRGGGALRPQSVYHKERSYFLEKWRHVIRDDPYFNPSLSLYDRTPKLG